MGINIGTTLTITLSKFFQYNNLYIIQNIIESAHSPCGQDVYRYEKSDISNELYTQEIDQIQIVNLINVKRCGASASENVRARDFRFW